MAKKNDSVEQNDNSKKEGVLRRVVAKLASLGEGLIISFGVVATTWDNPYENNETRAQKADLARTMIGAGIAKVKTEINSHSKNPEVKESAMEIKRTTEISNMIQKVVPEMVGLTQEEISDTVLDARKAEINEKNGVYDVKVEEQSKTMTMAEELRLSKKRASGNERSENIKGAITETMTFITEILAPVVASVLTPITLFAAINKACVIDPNFEREKRLFDKDYRQKAKSFAEKYEKFCNLIEERKPELVALLKETAQTKKVDERAREIIIECARKADLGLAKATVKTSETVQQAQGSMA